MIASHSALGNALNGCRRWIPALLTRMSIPPQRAVASAMPRRTAASRLTSNTLVSTARPSASSCAAARVNASPSRPLRITLAPALASPRAIASPKPRCAPVTSATRPDRSKGLGVMALGPSRDRRCVACRGEAGLRSIGGDRARLRGRDRFGRAAEAIEQRRLAGLGLRDLPLLHVPVAPDVLGNRRELDRGAVVVRREAAEQLVDERLVLR